MAGQDNYFERIRSRPYDQAAERARNTLVPAGVAGAPGAFDPKATVPALKQVGEWSKQVALGAVQGPLDAVNAMAKKVNTPLNEAYKAVTGAARGPLIDVNDEGQRITPELPGQDPESLAGGLSRGISTFMTLYGPLSAQLAVAGAGGALGSMAAGAFADMMAFENKTGTLADVARSLGFDNELTQALSGELSDSEWEASLKAALEGAGLGLLGPAYGALRSGLRRWPEYAPAFRKRLATGPIVPGSPAAQRGSVGGGDQGQGAADQALPVSAEFQPYEAKLTPEARTNLRAMRADAEAYLPKYKTILQEIAKTATGDAGNALVADVKGWDRVTQKVVMEEGGDAAGIRDFVRGTILVRSRAEAEQVWKDLQAKFKPAANAPRTSLLDGRPDTLGYADLKMNIIGPNGRQYEVQVTTPELWAAKEGEGHKLYERWRDIVGRVQAEQRPLNSEELAEKASIENQSREFYAAAFDLAAFSGGKPLSNTAPKSKRLNEPSASSSKQSE